SLVFFFFSSRRRHTRFSRDWSSDVCSSDLHLVIQVRRVARWGVVDQIADEIGTDLDAIDVFYRRSIPELVAELLAGLPLQLPVRSEERRVGKEGGAQGAEVEWRKKRRGHEG